MSDPPDTARRKRESWIAVAISFALGTVLALAWFLGYDLGLAEGVRTVCAVAALAFYLTGVRALFTAVLPARPTRRTG